MDGTTGGDGGGTRTEPTVRDRLRYLLVLSRPRFWFYLAGPVVVGTVYGGGSAPELVAPTALVLFGYFLVPANVLLYGVNDRFDADIDAENPKKAGGRTETESEAVETGGEAVETGGEAVETGGEAVETENEATQQAREARWRGDRVVAAAIIATGLLGLVTVAVTPPIAWPYLVGFFLLAVGYSAPPTRFKTTPLLDSASNGLYVLPGAAAYVAASGAHPPAAALAGAWIWAMAMHTFSAIPDIEPDREAGIRTTATALGERRAYGYCVGCWTLAAAAFSLVDVRLGALVGVYPVFVTGIALTDVAVDRAYWWFPALNTVVGAALTIGGLSRIVAPAEVRALIETWALIEVIAGVA
ncbi:prenyltransferase [Halopenitus persicus]|uniref:4-hydroxybenzoate polyprenyltransferase n=1 Tax=Halopenitus persicus TaxID=1048396 RepID=A0A1H3END4_9EURY|nr:prenyltransferase [Halopenitus persicus]SDX80283.1 4-hydroxybenzoate polyprenyltransferase [Halopenitus persicus]